MSDIIHQVYLVKTPEDNTEPIQNITRLEQDVVNVLKQHYGPYYSEDEAITGCMWGPGPIPYYLQPVYNCTLCIPNVKSSSLENSIKLIF